ncbi:Seripauperin and TIP1 family-domain-containing protein, partial [Scheffersomyces coipomensis]|uniref:Seripauperin and TIP1 family-domain-containing protein n=1 Tax=Scheffersomyces coipomensis TaxID=1788519 RepID=UPI00315D7A72
MNLISILSITLLLNLSSFINAESLDSSQLHFLTIFVNDAKSHLSDYIQYIETATVSVPEGLTSLAIEVQTYTNDAYTSLLSSNGEINISQLETFATNLPWYSSRLEGSIETGATTSTATTTSTNGHTSSSTSVKTTSSKTTSTKSSKLPVNFSASLVPPATTSTSAGEGINMGSNFKKGSFLFSVGTILAML